MAVMTSQQADGVAGLPEKPVVTMATEASSTTTPDAPVAEAPKSDAAAAAPATADAVAAPTPDAPVKDVANGDQKETEVNGHDEEVSPKTLVPETKTDSLPTPKDEPLEEAQATPAKKEGDAPKAEESKEGEAKSDEKAQKEEEKPAPVEEEKKAEEPAKPEEEKVEGDKMEIDAPEPPAGDAPKESIASPAEDKAPEPAAEEQSKEEKPAAAEEAKEDKPAEPKADVATEAKADEAKEQKADEAKDVAPAPSATETPTTEPAPKPPASPAKQQEDVEMTDAPATVEEPAKTEESKPAEATPTATQQETQDTTVSDVPPPTPAGEEAKEDKDAPQPSPAAPVTADTSMSDAPPSSSKPYREREEDSEDEPVAKRAKVSPAADQASVKSEAKREDKMDVDSKPAASSASTPAPARNEPKSLADDSINHLPISDYMNRQIRMVLAGVKKTKAGYHFRLPVSELWPGLWNEYSAKVKDPVDIQTMERRLRGTLTKYQTLGDFKRDLDKLVQNSITFNGEFHDVTGAARSCRDTILSRLGTCPAFEPSRPEKKDVAKQHTTRHAEPRSATHHSSPPAHLPQRPQQPRVNTAAVPTPSSSKPIESPAFAIPANNNGMPLIRRDSTKPDSRAKRPVKPTHSKDLVYDTKRKKKLSPELRFCEEVLTELRKQRYYEFNEAFQKPVDPVALNIPTYHKIIKKPMDLSTMQSKLNAGDYANSKEFERDFDLIIKNCRLFNGEQHIVYDQALRLQSLYRREMSKKDEWLAKHAPPPAAHHSSNTSPRMKDESDWDEPESEGEPEVDEELKGAQQRLASYMKRLEEEQKKINDIMLEMNPNMADVEIAQSVVAMLQKQIITERSKIASMQPTKKAAPAKPHHAKPAASKPKKAMPSGGSSSHHTGGGNVAKKTGGGHSSMGGGHGGGMGGMPKKAAARKPAPKRKMGTVEKEVIAAGIAELEGSQLERAIQIIKDDTGTGENDSGELELDIDQLSQEALTQLYDLAIKAFPHLQREKERTMAAQAAPPPPPAPQRSKPVQKTKKNKPMSKMEQERRLQQLNELRAQAGRQGSGSQEPMESIEGTGRASVDPAPQHHREEDSEDEESSEEE